MRALTTADCFFLRRRLTPQLPPHRGVNYTIDDAQWATSTLLLTPDWNMLRINGSNQYINQTQVDAVTPLLPNFWNGSLSWTTTENASTTLVFTGTDISAYGLAGPGQGAYVVELDNKTIGRYTAHADEADFTHLLYAAHGLDSNTTHYLTLTNGANGTSLAF